MRGIRLLIKAHNSANQKNTNTTRPPPYARRQALERAQSPTLHTIANSLSLNSLCRRWLRSDGILLANFGVGDREVDYDEDWLGAPQFWSSFDADGERAVLGAAGFALVVDSIETTIVDGRPHRFLLVLARKA